MDLKQNKLLHSEKFKSFIQDLKIPSLQQSVFLEECKREIKIIRDDLIHPVISGNKWRKLNYHLHYFSENDFAGIASMGGAYSNHLHALAFVCNQLNIPCSLFIYGWNGEMNSPTLIDCKNWNASLHSITRQQAATFRIEGMNAITETIPNYYWIPEGGGGSLGEKGMKELINELPVDFDKKENLIVCACGTGTSIQGILDNTSTCKIASQQIVKMAKYTWAKNERIHMMPSKFPKSFAKKEHKLLDFMYDFKDKYDVLLDPIYTAPLMYSFLRISELQNYDDIYFIHTGGLQANRVH